MNNKIHIERFILTVGLFALLYSSNIIKLPKFIIKILENNIVRVILLSLFLIVELKLRLTQALIISIFFLFIMFYLQDI
jgi:hypothetical protein